MNHHGDNMKILKYIIAAAALFASHDLGAQTPPPAGPQITVERIMPPNLLANPSIEEGGSAGPKNWVFGSGEELIFRWAWAGNGRTGKCLWIKALGGRMSGYWSQPVRVTPGKNYVFRGHYRLGGGRILIWVNGNAPKGDGTNARIDLRFHDTSPLGHWLIPVFISPESLDAPDPNEWRSFELRGVVPEPITHIRLSLGMYFAMGEAWFDDLYVGLDEADVKFSIKPPPGLGIGRVVIKADGQEKPVIEAGPLAQGSAFNETLKGRPLNEKYNMTMHLSDGSVVQGVYPITEAKER